MAKTTKDTALALSQDGNVFNYLEQVKNKLAAVQEITDTPFKTSGRVTFPGGAVVDLKSGNETNVDKLAEAYSSVAARLDALDNAYDELGFTTRKVAKIDGGTKEDWKHDFKLRISIIENQATLNKLTKIKDGLTSLMDNSQKAALLMEELNNI